MISNSLKMYIHRKKLDGHTFDFTAGDSQNL